MMSCKPVRDKNAEDLEEYYKSNPKKFIKDKQRPRTYGVNRRKKMMEKKLEGLEEEEQRKIKWYYKLDSCLKQNIKIIIRDQKSIQQITKLNLDDAYKNFQLENSLPNWNALKRIFEAVERELEEEMSSIKNINFNSMNGVERVKAMKDWDDPSTAFKTKALKYKAREIEDKWKVIDFEITILDKIIRRLNDKLIENKIYTNKEWIDQSLKHAEDLFISTDYQKLIRFSTDEDDKILKNINKKSNKIDRDKLDTVSFMKIK